MPTLKRAACVLLFRNHRTRLTPESPSLWTSRRWRIAVLLGVGVIINLFDRALRTGCFGAGRLVDSRAWGDVFRMNYAARLQL